MPRTLQNRTFGFPGVLGKPLASLLESRVPFDHSGLGTVILSSPYYDQGLRQLRPQFWKRWQECE